MLSTHTIEFFCDPSRRDGNELARVCRQRATREKTTYVHGKRRDAGSGGGEAVLACFEVGQKE